MENARNTKWLVPYNVESYVFANLIQNIPGIQTESRPRVCRKCFEALMYHQQGIKPPTWRDNESSPADSPAPSSPANSPLPPVPSRNSR